MYNLSDINTIKQILGKHGFSFSKALGQNFIIDEEVCPKMAEEAVPGPEYGVIEVGPGIGVLTTELAKRAKKVVSIELDERLIPVLSETLEDFDNVKIINDDILKIDLKKLCEEEFEDMKIVICANLPYYITSPVIMMLLESNLPVESITVMVQAEAADRLCAPVGTRDAGAVTIAVNVYADAEELFYVPRECFLPSPKVDSKVIKLTLNKKYDIKNEKQFFSMVKGAFTMRRKTILNSLTAGLSVSKNKIEPVLDILNTPQNSRIEQLTMEEIINIHNSFSK